MVTQPEDCDHSLVVEEATATKEKGIKEIEEGASSGRTSESNYIVQFRLLGSMSTRSTPTSFNRESKLTPMSNPASSEGVRYQCGKSSTVQARITTARWQLNTTERTLW